MKPRPTRRKATQQEFPDDLRNGLLAKIHIAKKQLALDEDIYRSILVQITGKDSCKDMDGAELNRVLTYFYNKGFKERGESLSPSSRNKSVKTLKDKAIALWINLYKEGKVENRSHEALGNFVRRFLGDKLTVFPGVDPLDAATDAQLSDAVEALKKMHEREEPKQDGSLDSKQEKNNA